MSLKKVRTSKWPSVEKKVLQRGRRDGKEIRRKRERIGASSFETKQGESREGPSKI